MKKIIIFLAFAALNHVCTLAQTKYEMVIEKTDGSEVTINVEEIIRTYFREINTGGEEPTALSSCPDGNHPHMIDLGLPSGTLWACCNVGANAPEEYGGRFAWGETEEKGEYTWATYQHGYYDWNTGDMSTIKHIGYDISGTKYDVAHTRWGQGWHMPKLSQIEELVANTTAEWYANDDIMGCKLLGSNGSNIFIPASGLYIDYLDPEISLSWSSTVEKFEEPPYYSSPDAYTLLIRPVRNPNIGLFVDYCPNLEFRFNGLTVRPVKESNP